MYDTTLPILDIHSCLVLELVAGTEQWSEASSSVNLVIAHVAWQQSMQNAVHVTASWPSRDVR